MQFLTLTVISSLALTGCAGLSPAKPESYCPGQNFGDSGATRCPTRMDVDGRLPFCGYPNDGDSFDTRLR